VAVAFTFDTLEYSKRLRDSGVPEEQAVAHAGAARDFIMTELVTKSDLYAVRSDLKSDIQALEAKLLAVKNELQAAIDKSALQATVRFGGIVAVGIGILAALLRMR
jgi:hypothetical protein